MAGSAVGLSLQTSSRAPLCILTFVQATIQGVYCVRVGFQRCCCTLGSVACTAVVCGERMSRRAVLFDACGEGAGQQALARVCEARLRCWPGELAWCCVAAGLICKCSRPAGRLRSSLARTKSRGSPAAGAHFPAAATIASTLRSGIEQHFAQPKIAAHAPSSQWCQPAERASTPQLRPAAPAWVGHAVGASVMPASVAGADRARRCSARCCCSRARACCWWRRLRANGSITRTWKVPCCRTRPQ